MEDSPGLMNWIELQMIGYVGDVIVIEHTGVKKWTLIDIP